MSDDGYGSKFYGSLYIVEESLLSSLIDKDVPPIPCVELYTLWNTMNKNPVAHWINKWTANEFHSVWQSAMCTGITSHFDGKYLTYTQCMATVINTIQQLKNIGVKQGQTVGPVYKNRMDLQIIVFACMVMGAIPVLYDPPFRRGTKDALSRFEKSFLRVCDHVVYSPVQLGCLRVEMLNIAGNAHKLVDVSTPVPKISGPIPGIPLDIKSTAMIVFPQGETSTGVEMPWHAVLHSMLSQLSMLDCLEVPIPDGYDYILDSAARWEILARKCFQEKGHSFRFMPCASSYYSMTFVGSYLLPLMIGGESWAIDSMVFHHQPEKALNFLGNWEVLACYMPDTMWEMTMRKNSTFKYPKVQSNTRLISAGECPRLDTVQGMITRFQGQINPEQIAVGYGITECISAVTGTTRGKPLTYFQVHADSLRKDGKVKIVQNGPVTMDKIDRASTVTMVNSGHPIPGMDVVVINLETLTPCAALTVGEIWVSGKSVCNQYWSRSKSITRVFYVESDGSRSATSYIRTGDLGFLCCDASLTVIGSMKSAFNVNGSTYNSEEIEACIKRDGKVRPNSLIVFPILNQQGDSMQVGVVAEIRPEAHLTPSGGLKVLNEDMDTLTRLVSRESPEYHVYSMALNMDRLAQAELGVRISKVWVVKADTLPKTPGGNPSRNLFSPIPDVASAVGDDNMLVYIDLDYVRNLVKTKFVEAANQNRL